MTERAKIGLYTLIGALGGLAAFALVGIVSLLKESFGSYLLFNVLTGSCFGLAIGAALGSVEGIVHGNKHKIQTGLLFGSLAGLAGGMVGVFLGQSILLRITTMQGAAWGEMPPVTTALISALCWTVMGIFVAMGEGFRSKSGMKLGYGILGGLVGGFLGGFVLEILTSRLLGLVILGAAVTFFYALMEKNFSKGVLRVLNGTMKGKKLALNQRTLTLGHGIGNDLALFGYEGVEEKCHAVLSVRSDGVTLEPFSHRYKVFVNDEKVQKAKLKYEDVIRIGEARFLYEVK